MELIRFLLFIFISFSRHHFVWADATQDELLVWRQQNSQIERCTDFSGIPYPSLTASQAIGTNGPVLLQDRSLIESTSAFNRERIPERVVHAKGPGAIGKFTVTHDVSRWTRAKFLNQIGKRTPVFLRFSNTAAERGYPDTLRDARGFAVKFKTEDGNFDLPGNQIEVFNIRDPMLFPDVNRSRKRNPQTHLRDPVMFWDFIQKRPETTHHILKIFADLSSPESLRMINGSGVHTYKLVNGQGEIFFCKFHFIAHQTFKLMSDERMVKLAGSDPNYFHRDLYNAIATGDFPKWAFAIQVATPAEAESYQWDYLDVTKNWRLEDFPLHPIGVMELNVSPSDFFTGNELLAYSPANLVPGIEPSADRVLQARMQSYPDSQRYRIGTNHNQLKINAPVNKVSSYERDGQMCLGENGGGGPNYFPNSFNGPRVDPTAAQSTFFVDGDVRRVDTKDADNFSQPRLYLNQDISADEKRRIAVRIGNNLAKVSSPEVRELVLLNNFMPTDRQFTNLVRAAMVHKLENPDPKIAERPAAP